LLDFEKERTQ